MKEFAVLWLVGGDVDELENERTACDDATTTRQEITADNRFQHGRFSGALAADHGDLR